MPGPTPKTQERRQRANSNANLVIPFRVMTPVYVPPMPPNLLASTKALWKNFWDSTLAAAIETKTDTAALYRYFTLLDERERAFRAYRRKRLVLGSTGQSVANPMLRAMHGFDAELRQMEDRLGLSPRARLQLGVTFGEAARSMAELNKMLNEDEETDDETSDPRQA